MPRKAAKSPQQKKQESYEKDRRNAFGENSKSSRKNIPRGKRSVASVNRIRAAQPLRQPVTDVDSQEAVQDAVQAKRPRRWKKSPDIPLKEHLKQQGRRRSLRKGRKVSRKSGQAPAKK